MASVDTQSVRNEVKRLKTEFEILEQNDRVSAEVLVLVRSLLTILEIIMAIFLERTTKKMLKTLGLVDRSV